MCVLAFVSSKRYLVSIMISHLRPKHNPVFQTGYLIPSVLGCACDIVRFPFSFSVCDGRVFLADYFFVSIIFSFTSLFLYLQRRYAMI